MKPSHTKLKRLLAMAIAAALPLMLVVGCDEGVVAEEQHAEAVAADMGLGSDPAFEWMGVYELPTGRVELAFQPGPDETMGIALVPVAPDAAPPFDMAVAAAGAVGQATTVPVEPGETIEPGDTHYALDVGGDERMRFAVDVPVAGRYALFTQHFADEFQTVFLTQDGSRAPVLADRIFKERFGQIAISGKAQETFGVRVGTVEQRALAATISAPARVGFNEERMAYVGSLVAGRVSKINARLGDAVDVGDVLLVVDSPELGRFQGDYLAKRSAVEAARPAVELAQNSYERARKLFDETEGGGVTLNEVQRREAELRAAEREMVMAEAEVTSAANALRLHGMSDGQIEALGESKKVVPSYEVTAPIAGEVVSRDVTPGALVGPDDESLMTLADLSTVWVLADVAEARLGDIGVGSVVTITVPASGDAEFEGTVTYVDPRVNESTRTVRLRVEVPNPDGRLRPGMFARAEIAARSGEQTPVVPAEAVIEVDGQSVVFVPMKGKADTFLRRPVTLGERAGGMFPVLLGIEAGEPVVTAGVFTLKADLGKSGASHGH